MDEGALTRALCEPRVQNSHDTSHQGCAETRRGARARARIPHGRGGEKDRAGSVCLDDLGCGGQPLCGRWSLPFTAVSSCELARDLACRTQFRDSVASVSK